MGLFRRSKTARTSKKPTWRERKAAERTARAEASLVETEQKIHQIADQARSDLRGTVLSRSPPGARSRLAGGAVGHLTVAWAW
jgi:hypothetical protein